MTEYGLPGLRDKDGDLQAVDHTFEWSGQEITIKLQPPTIAEIEELEELDDDADPSELEEILDRHIIKPEVDGSWTAREMWAYIEGIMQFSMGDDDGGIAGEIADELDERGNGTGN